jgi:hypothetical protein
LGVKENFAAKGDKNAQKPPRIIKKQDWSDGFAIINSSIPAYQVTEDKHAASYL